MRAREDRGATFADEPLELQARVEETYATTETTRVIHLKALFLSEALDSQSDVVKAVTALHS